MLKVIVVTAADADIPDAIILNTATGELLNVSLEDARAYTLAELANGRTAHTFDTTATSTVRACPELVELGGTALLGRL
jgi:hypothetical protein